MARLTFTKAHPRFGNFTDAVDVADDATPAQIEAVQAERFDAWVNFLQNPQPAPAEDQPVEAMALGEVALEQRSVLVDPAVAALDAIWEGRGTDEDYATVRAKLEG